MTILAGSNAKTGVFSGVGGTGSFAGFAQKYVAVATGAITSGYCWLGNANLTGFNCVVAVYNSTGASLLGSSAATLINVGGWTTCAFSGGPTLTSGTTYALAIYVSPKVYFDVGNAAASLGAAVPHYSNPGSDPTVSVPSSFNLGVNYMSSADMSVYVENVSGGSSATALPGVGLVTVGGLVPAILDYNTVLPGVGAVSVAGLIPTLIKERTVTPSVGAVTVGGLSPAALDVDTIGPSSGLVTITGLAPTVVQSTTLATALAGVGAVTIAGLAPTVTSSSAVPFVGRRRRTRHYQAERVIEPVSGPLVPAFPYPPLGSVPHLALAADPIAPLEARITVLEERARVAKEKRRKQNQRALELLLMDD